MCVRDITTFSTWQRLPIPASNLIREAQTLYHQKFTDKRLKHVYESLSLLLEHVHISLRPAMASEEDRLHYIPLLPTFSHDFSRRIRRGFDQLLQYPPLQKSHVAGSLLIAPIDTMLMQEAYWVQREQVLRADARYDEFPFLVFRSLTLSEARSKIFSVKYLFMSQELNIITMLLSSGE